MIGKPGWIGKGFRHGDTWDEDDLRRDRGYPHVHFRAHTRFDRISGAAAKKSRTQRRITNASCRSSIATWRPTRCPKSLGELNWIFCRDSDDFEEATDTLIRALDTDLKWVRAHTRLLTRAIEWDANGRNNSFVLRGEDLRSAEQWLAEAGAQKERQPTALQTEYIIASRKAAARRQRITLGAVTFGFVVAIVLAVVAQTSVMKLRQKEAKAKDQTKKTSEAASRGNVSLARYSKEGGKNAQALAQLAQALRLNPENREASGLTAAMLTQLSWHVPLTGSMRHECRG